MFHIDTIAYTNQWSRRHPVEKLLFAGGMLFLSLLLPPMPAALIIIVLVSLASIWGAKIPGGFYLKILALPVGFLLLSTPMLFVSVHWSHGLHFALSPEGVNTALKVVLRSLAAVSCLSFLALTTPMTDLVPLLSRVRVPAAVIELMLLTYRLIFVASDTVAAAHRSQSARLGYQGFMTSCRSLSLLVAALFDRTMGRVRQMETGLSARGFEGEFKFLTEEKPVSSKTLTLIACLLLVVVATSLACNGFLHELGYPGS